MGETLGKLKNTEQSKAQSEDEDEENSFHRSSNSKGRIRSEKWFPMPKTIMFRGLKTENFDTFRMRIESYLEDQKHLEDYQLVNCVWQCLDGAAADWFHQRPKASTLVQALDMLANRYSENTDPALAVVELSTMEQEEEEDPEIFSDRVEKKINQAYPEAAEKIKRVMRTQHCSKGIRDVETRRHVLLSDPQNMADALRAYKKHQAAARLTDRSKGSVNRIEGGSKFEVREGAQGRFSGNSDDRFANKSMMKSGKNEQGLDKISDQMKEILEAMSGIKADVENLKNDLAKKADKSERYGSAQRQNSRPSGEFSGSCFGCGKKGHMRYNCPNEQVRKRVANIARQLKCESDTLMDDQIQITMKEISEVRKEELGEEPINEEDLREQVMDFVKESRD